MWFVAALGFKGILRIIELLVSHPSLPVHSIQFSVCSWAVLVGEDIKRRQPAIFLFTSALLWQSWLETLTGSLTLLASCRGGEVVSVSVGKVLGHLRLSTTAEPCRKVLGWKQNKQKNQREKKICLLTWSLSFIWNRKTGACTDMNHHPCSVPCFLFSW